MRLAFDAIEGGFTIDDGVLLCGVRGNDHYLVFQGSASGPDEEASVYIEYDDQINGGYDQIDRCCWTPTSLSVDLIFPFKRMEGVIGIDVRFTMNPEQCVVVREGLLRIFERKRDLFEIIEGHPA